MVAGNPVRRALYGIDTWSDEWPNPRAVVRAVVRGNVISDGTSDGTGVLTLEDTSTYSGNRVSGYDTGVEVFGEAILLANDFRGNDSWDCWDSVGIATWIDNLGDTSQPAGICMPAP